MQRAVLIKAIDTPFQWITTSVEEATDFTIHMEKNGYKIETDPHMVWPEKTKIVEVYSDRKINRRVLECKRIAISQQFNNEF